MKDHKILKIIVTTGEKRTVREFSGICGNPPGYFSHSQKFENNQDILQLIDLNLNMEYLSKNFKNYDILIVNNDAGDEIFAKGLADKINHYKEIGLNVNLYSRENKGRAFGAYYDVIIKNINCYDYFMITEDDVILGGHNYITEILKYMKQDVGFVSILGIYKENKLLGYGRKFHAHGSIGLLSKSCALNLIDKGLFANGNMSTDYQDIILDGEVRLTNEIKNIGYEVVEVNKSEKFYNFAYDLVRNINMPRYLSFTEMVKFNYSRIKDFIL